MVGTDKVYYMPANKENGNNPCVFADLQLWIEAVYADTCLLLQ